MVGGLTVAEPDEVDPFDQDVHDAVVLACAAGRTGGEIIAAVQRAIAAARDVGEPVAA